MATVREIMKALGELYPWELAPKRDRSGLLVGSLECGVIRVLCSVELTSRVVEMAVHEGYELLVTHHNQVLSNSATPWDAGGPAGALASLALAAGLNVVACHANADEADGGAADLMARRLGLRVEGPIRAATGVYLAKVVVFAPREALEGVADAMSAAGAGVIGGYTRCSFRTPGVGTFVPGPAARPYSGERGIVSEEEEVRLEMICPSFRVGRVVGAMVGAHPYEEVAYDVYRTETPVPWGAGRMGTLGQERTCEAILEDLAAWSGSSGAALFGDPTRRVTAAAVAPGVAGALVRPAYRAGCGLLVAGEVGWHDTVEALEAGMAVICLGNVESERALVPAMVGLLTGASEHGSWELDVEGYRQKEGHWG